MSLLVKRNKSGFTIVELLVVIVVIGILATITIVSYTGISNKAKIATIQSDLKNASTQLEISKTNDASERYPTTGGNIRHSNSTTFNYSYNSTNNTYCLTASDSSSNSYYITSANKQPTLGACPITAGSFVVEWGGTGEDPGKSIVQTTDGGYAVTGQTNSYGAGNEDMFIAKYDSTGTLSWSKTWGGTNSEYGLSIVQTSDGGYVVTGYTTSYGAGGIDMFIAKYDSTGTLSWSKTWGGTNYDYGLSIIQTTDGGYAVTGDTNSYGAGNYDMFIAKYDSTGTLSWSKTWGGTNIDYGGQSVAQTSDGGYAVTGYTVSYGAGGADMFIAKYDSVGTLSWSKTWGGTNSDYGLSIVKTTDGGCAVTGYTVSYGAGNNDMFIAKYNSAGTLSWAKTWGGTDYDYGKSIVQTTDGGYAVTGETGSYGAGYYDMFLAKYDSTGTLSWSKTWGGTGADRGYSIVQTTDGGYAVTGYTDSYEVGGDMFIAKYNSSGSIVGCSSPMCQSPTATVTTPSATTASPSATTTTPSATTTSPSATTTSPSATTTVIVTAQ